METTAPTAPCGCHTACAAPEPGLRPESVHRALRLEYLTVGWNVVEGIVAVTAALIAGSVAILGFGIDSFVECASALVMIWRLGAERADRLGEAELEAREHRARRRTAGSVATRSVAPARGGDRRGRRRPTGRSAIPPAQASAGA